MESSDQVNSDPVVVETVAVENPVQNPANQANKPEIDEIKQIKETIEPERTQEELAAMLRVLIANFCDEHFVKRLKKAKLLMDKSVESQKTNEQKVENSDKDAEKDRDHIDEIDTANLTLSPPSSSVSNYSQTNKPTENEPKAETETPAQNQEPSNKAMSSILVGLDKLEIFGSIHVRTNNVRLLSCLIDEQLTINNSDVSFSFSSASSSISSAGHYKFHKHRHGHHRRHRGRHGYKKFRKIKQLKIQQKDDQPNGQEINYPIKKFKAYHNYKEKKDEEGNEREQKRDGEKSQETDNLNSLASVAAQAVKLNTEKNSERNRKSRKSSNVVPIHDDSELEYMNDELEGEHFSEENPVNEALYAEDDENSSVISESFSDSSLLRHRRHRSNSSLYSEPSSIISSRSASNKNNRLSRSPSLGASSYGFENEYRSYSSCSSLSDYDGYGYEGRKSHKRKDKNDRNKSDRKRISKESENMINAEDIKVEKEAEKEVEQTNEEPENNPIEERRREEEYLMRKYKRRFSSFKNTDPQDQNLYLLETSRQHHRVYDMNSENNQSGEQQGYIHHQKIMNVNSLVDRLSPISDPDMEQNLKNKAQNFNTEAPTNSNTNPQKTEILNRINNLSPSSSSSSSSSIKNQNSLAAFHSLHNSQQNNAAAVLAAAAAAAAAAADLRGIHPHAHLNHNTPLHNHHAQSVAQLLADMQQQQQQQSQSEAAKVLAATLSNHHHPHHAHLNPHHLLGRFSNNQQNDLMAAVLAQQQQQQQQQHRSLLDSHTHLNSHQSYSSNGQLNQNGPIYNRYSSHLNAAIAAASAAAANLNSHQRRANSVESDATPSPPSTTPAVNGISNNNSQSISSAASSASSTSENYKYKEEPKVSKEKTDSGNGNEKVRLVPGYDVFISTNDLNACNDDRGSATRLLRNLMDVFFDKSTLAKSSINGTGRITNTLDKHVISALFAYVKNRYADVPHSQLTRAATDKCVQTRRNFRKKIKAAQSYFGMFPSLMMARPPQLPQGSENPV